MIKIRHILSTITAFLIPAFLYSCSTTPVKVPPQTLIRLPEKKIVKLDTITDEQLRKSRKADTKELKAELKLIVPSVEPIWRPPVVARVLILPYVDRDNVLHGGQYVFVQLKKGGWLFGKYLFRKPKIVMDPLSDTRSSVSSLPLPSHMSRMTPSKGLTPRAAKPSTGRPFFSGGNPNLPSASGQFTYGTQSSGPSKGYQEQFNTALHSIHH